MNASELADRLEYWREKIVESQSIDDDKLSTSAFASVAFNYAKVILKSLRFAADMEKIYEHCGEIVIRKRENPHQEIQYLSGRVSKSEGDSIYTAARNAVEKLEGK